MGNVKVLGINAKDCKIEVLDFEDNCENICKYIGCDFFDVPMRKIDNSIYDIYCDDMGLFKGLTPSVLTIKRNDGLIVEQIVGNVIIAKHNRVGEMKSLTESEIDALTKMFEEYKVLISVID